MNSLQNSVIYPFPAEVRTATRHPAGKKGRRPAKSGRQGWLCCILYGLLADSPLAVLLPFAGFALGAVQVILHAPGHSLWQLLPRLGMVAAAAAAGVLLSACCCVMEDKKGRYPDFLKSLTVVYTVVGLAGLSLLFLLLGHI